MVAGLTAANSLGCAGADYVAGLVQDPTAVLDLTAVQAAPVDPAMLSLTIRQSAGFVRSVVLSVRVDSDRWAVLLGQANSAKVTCSAQPLPQSPSLLPGGFPRLAHTP